MKTKEYNLENAPSIKGLHFRSFAGETDYSWMAKIIEKASAADQDDRATTVEDIRNDYEHLTHSDPYQDIIFACIDEEAIAYSRVEWFQEEDPNDRIYSLFVFIIPEWREKGIETAMVGWCEARLREIAQAQPQDSRRLFQTYSSEIQKGFNRIIDSLGYNPVRYFIEMSRPLENIPTAELPEGIEVRPVEEKDIRKIWDASVEAFRDHWGFSLPEEEDFISYQNSKYFQPDYWQVAWKGDEVVGSVQNYIDHDYNQKCDRKRGWTEEITTHRDFRRQGIAKALIVRSMHMHKAKGMTEVALGVDTDNPNGALQLYQSLGYQKQKTMITFRKEIK